MCDYALCLDATTSNVELTVFRRGELGIVEVGWTTIAQDEAGFTPGSVLPETGTLQFPPQQNTTVLILTVSGFVKVTGLFYLHIVL